MAKSPDRSEKNGGGSARWKWAVAGACAVVAAVVLALTFFGRSDEDEIRRALAKLAKAVAVKEDENALARMGRVQSELRDVVDDDVSVDVRDLGIRLTGRRKLAESAAQVGAAYTSASCDLAGLTIRIDPAATTAKADGRAVVSAVRGGERVRDERDVHFLLRKDGGWKITSIDVFPRDGAE